MRTPKEDPRQTPFLSIVLYIFGFMVALALLAWAGAWLMRHI